jgi:hypothetical protein
MSYLRYASNIFLLFFVLAWAVPTSTPQDNTKTNDASSQSDNSNDQQNEDIILSDFIFEHLSVFDKQFSNEICEDRIPKGTDRHLRIQIFSEASILPHFVNSECGLMPRAPAQA